VCGTRAHAQPTIAFTLSSVSALEIAALTLTFVIVWLPLFSFASVLAILRKPTSRPAGWSRSWLRDRLALQTGLTALAGLLLVGSVEVGCARSYRGEHLYLGFFHGKLEWFSCSRPAEVSELSGTYTAIGFYLEQHRLELRPDGTFLEVDATGLRVRPENSGRWDSRLADGELQVRLLSADAMSGWLTPPRGQPVTVQARSYGGTLYLESPGDEDYYFLRRKTS
jgi:hypothetical protein